MTPVVISIGLIEGRHPLPVERYLLTGPVDASPAATPALYKALDAVVCALAIELEAADVRPGDTQEVRLYLTGLTRAALLAVNLLCRVWVAWESLPFDQPEGERPEPGEGPRRLLTLMEYDAATGAYVPTLFAEWPGDLLVPVPT